MDTQTHKYLAVAWLVPYQDAQAVEQLFAFRRLKNLGASRAYVQEGGQKNDKSYLNG
jgi:hypothetical protein